MNTLVKSLEGPIKAASFSNGIQRERQTSGIAQLIKECIEQERKIDIIDIITVWYNCNTRTFHLWGIVLPYFDENGKYTSKWMKLPEVLTIGRDPAEKRAKGWFMQNLGAAIIKGKLLVIPVIDIE